MSALVLALEGTEHAANEHAAGARELDAMIESMISSFELDKEFVGAHQWRQGPRESRVICAPDARVRDGRARTPP